jgi:hypothetical protein
MDATEKRLMTVERREDFDSRGRALYLLSWTGGTGKACDQFWRGTPADLAAMLTRLGFDFPTLEDA